MNYWCLSRKTVWQAYKCGFEIWKVTKMEAGKKKEHLDLDLDSVSIIFFRILFMSLN